MSHAAESLERAEHASHAGHSHGTDGDKLPTRIGITMALLGVLLAFNASKVGYERAELVQYLVDQQHAHLKYQAQDIKHRVAMLSLQQMHAEPDALKANAADMIAIANSARRYSKEAELASEWVDAYDPIVAAHAEAQEEYEHAQLAAELGIVVASIALLLKRRLAWFLALGLGLTSVVMLTVTWRHTAHALAGAEAKAEEAEKSFLQLRQAGKTTDADQALVDEVLKAYEKPTP